MKAAAFTELVLVVLLITIAGGNAQLYGIGGGRPLSGGTTDERHHELYKDLEVKSAPGRYGRRDKPPAYKRRNGYDGGAVGPVHTFVKTDENANFKWGVRHLIG